MMTKRQSTRKGAILTQAPSPRSSAPELGGSPQRKSAGTQHPAGGAGNIMTSTWMRFSTCLTSNPVSSWPLSPRHPLKKEFWVYAQASMAFPAKLALPEMPSSPSNMTPFCVLSPCEKPHLRKAFSVQDQQKLSPEESESSPPPVKCGSAYEPENQGKGTSYTRPSVILTVGKLTRRWHQTASSGPSICSPRQQTPNLEEQIGA